MSVLLDCVCTPDAKQLMEYVYTCKISNSEQDFNPNLFFIITSMQVLESLNLQTLL